MSDYGTFDLSTAQLAILGFVVLGMVLRGRVEWLVGIYAAMPAWTVTVKFGPVAHTWVLLLAMAASGFVYMMHYRHTTPFAIWPERRILFWMAIWWVWMAIVIINFRPPIMLSLFQYMLLHIAVPTAFLLLFAHDPRRLYLFALAFGITSALGALYMLDMAGGLLTFLIDPGSVTWRITRVLGIVNYHRVAQGMGIGIILLVGVFATSRGWFARLAVLPLILLCSLMLYYSGSRQMLVATTISLVTLGLWLTIRLQASRFMVLLLAGGTLAFVYFLYQTAPTVFLRADPIYAMQVLPEAAAFRSSLWQDGWADAVQSPIWGWGFTRPYSHNLFIGALADQGIVGFIFLMGFLYFLSKQALTTLRQPEVDERTLWTMVFLCIAVFGLVHAQVSGFTISNWHLFWATFVVWRLNSTHEPVGDAKTKVRRRRGYLHVRPIIAARTQP